MSAILHVDDDPAVLQTLGRLLADFGTVRFATNGPDALQLARQAVPDLIILDAQMPGMSGFQVFDCLKLDPELARVPVIFMTSHSEPGFEACALDMGAADFIAKPFKPYPLLARIRARLGHAGAGGADLAAGPPADPLGAMASRRQFDTQLRLRWRRSQAAGEPLALHAIHIDHFLALREERGPTAANAQLRDLARVVAGAIRSPAELLARCADDEFALLLPGTHDRAACEVAQLLLSGLARLRERERGRERIGAGNAALAFSIGVAGAGRPLPGAGAGDLLIAARHAMHAARAAGGGQAWRGNVADPFGVCRPVPRGRQDSRSGVPIPRRPRD